MKGVWRPVWLGTPDIRTSLYTNYTMRLVQQGTLFFTKHFDHTMVVFFSGNMTVQHINTQLKPEMHKLVGNTCLKNHSWDGHVQAVGSG